MNTEDVTAHARHLKVCGMEYVDSGDAAAVFVVRAPVCAQVTIYDAVAQE